MSCACPACTSDPAPTYTEAFRALCEARWVLKHNKAWRNSYYAEVLRARGSEAARLLVSDVRALYEESKEAA